MKTLSLKGATASPRRLRGPVVLALGLDSAIWLAILATLRMIPF